MQMLNFVLANGQRARTMLLPKPDQEGKQVAHVDLQCTDASGTGFLPIANNAQSRSIIEAGETAFEHAKFQASRVSSAVARIELEGEEFLEKLDLERIVGDALPVERV
jgi:hypothetical protein